MKNLAPAVRASLCALAATAFAVSSYAADKIPITTSSEEARQLYLKGREKMAAIDQAGKDLVALSGAQNQMGNILIEAGRIDEAVKKYQEQVATIDKADAPAQVKEAAHRQALFDESRVALARHDVAGAKAKAAAYASAVAAHKVPFEMRQTHELAGRIALEEKKPGVAVSELALANQQDPRVLYLLAVAHQAAGDPVKAKLAGVQAADFNGLSNTYGYVRAKAKAMVTAPKKN